MRPLEDTLRNWHFIKLASWFTWIIDQKPNGEERDKFLNIEKRKKKKKKKILLPTWLCNDFLYILWPRFWILPNKKKKNYSGYTEIFHTWRYSHHFDPRVNNMFLKQCWLDEVDPSLLKHIIFPCPWTLDDKKKVQ